MRQASQVLQNHTDAKTNTPHHIWVPLRQQIEWPSQEYINEYVNGKAKEPAFSQLYKVLKEETCQANDAWIQLCASSKMFPDGSDYNFHPETIALEAASLSTLAFQLSIADSARQQEIFKNLDSNTKGILYELFGREMLRFLYGDNICKIVRTPLWIDEQDPSSGSDVALLRDSYPAVFFDITTYATTTRKENHLCLDTYFSGVPSIVLALGNNPIMTSLIIDYLVSYMNPTFQRKDLLLYKPKHRQFLSTLMCQQIIKFYNDFPSLRIESKIPKNIIDLFKIDFER